MTDQSHKDPKKPVLHVVPAILTGAAALIASLTAVYVNVRHDREAAAQQQAAPLVAPAAAPAPVPERETPAIDRWRLTVDRIAVEHDGSPGTTDWRFTVEADGEPLFAFQQDELDDTGGRNVAAPKDAAGVLRLEGRTSAKIVVKGWRGRLLGLGGEADATGEGTLTAGGKIGAIRVAAPKPEGGAFVFHLSADDANAAR